MATISNTPRPGYVWDSTDNVWYPIGVGGHSHSEIAKTIADAKGDLIVGTAADTVDRLAVGNNGETLVADSVATTGLRWQGNYSAGKNAIINGDMNIWQRGTSFSNTGGYTADRFTTVFNGGTPTGTISRQTFTPGTAPVAGYESAYFFRYNYTALNSANIIIVQQLIEDVRTFAGETITISFWAKADTTRTVSSMMRQFFGSGGSPSAAVDTASQANSVTTSWQRFTQTVAIPSISGKTIGTTPDSNLQLHIYLPITAGSTIDIWGVQVEAGSVATAFQTATGTLQGELAACQRYFYLLASGSGQMIANGFYVSATQYSSVVPLPVTMRSTPTLSVVTGSNYYATWNGASDLLDSLTILLAGTKVTGLTNTTEAAGTQYRPAYLETNNAASFVAYSAEL